MPRHSSERTRSSSKSPKKRSSKGEAFDLSEVDKSFGQYADLYSDVLRISSAATDEQIQLAYFDRRSELFTLLAKIDAKSQDDRTAKERRQAERRMDAVVLSVRILGDATTREQYDKIRKERLLNRRRAKSNRVEQEYNRKPVLQNRSANEAPKSSTGEKSSSKGEKSSSKKSRGHRRESSTTSVKQEKQTNLNDTISTQDNTVGDDATYDTYTVDENRQDDTTIGSGTIGSHTLGTATIGDATMDTYSIMSYDDGTDTGFLCGGSRIVRKITSEVKGAFEDTATSFDQVFNVFTLTDKDIRAVTKRIDKAKRQLEN